MLYKINESLMINTDKIVSFEVIQPNETVTRQQYFFTTQNNRWFITKEEWDKLFKKILVINAMKE